MAMIDGTRDAKDNCRALFLRAQAERKDLEGVPFDPREVPTDPSSTAIRVVAVDATGNPIDETIVDGVRTATDSTRLAPLRAPTL